MSKTERKRIIDHIFRHPETPEEIRQQFERWMLAREHDSGIDEILWDIWENHAAPASEEEDRRGLERLRASLRASRVRTLPRRVLRYAGMAAAVVLVFLGGYFAATQTLAPEKEVTLLTAKGHVGEFTLPDGTKVDARNYSQWFSSRLIFDNTPLKDIIINLERRYNIEISLSSNISPEKRLSLVVCHEPLEDLMEVMSSLMSIRYRIDGNRVLITQR